MVREDDDLVELEEPDSDQEDNASGNEIWMRGLWMLILAFLFSFASTVLGIVAIIQFLWMLFAKEKNELLSDFGKDMGRWLSDVALFQSGASDEKPFPWKKWG
ncbi:MAG: DUF4389 domain-containing protein [Marinosulfonomonas sp.]